MFRKLCCTNKVVISNKDNILFYLDFTVLKNAVECKGSERFKGELVSAEACATACRGTSQLFIYGTNEFGEKRCDSKAGIQTCDCWCQDETEDYKCKKETKNKGYRLFAFNKVTPTSGKWPPAQARNNIWWEQIVYTVTMHKLKDKRNVIFSL